MKIFTCVQYSPAWWAVRRGIPTASQFDRVITPRTLKPSAQADAYIAELIADRACQTPPFFTERPMSRDAANGLNMEPEARKWYALAADVEVQQVGFCLSDCGRFGCSPDGLVGTGGGLELKCPALKTHVRYLQAGTLPDEYKAQVHGSLLVTGRDWWDFVSYAPGLPPLRIRVEPDEFTGKLAAALDDFWAKYQRALEQMRRLAAYDPADNGIDEPAARMF